MDQIVLIPASVSTTVIWTWHALFKPVCVKVVTFFYLQRAHLNTSTALFMHNFTAFKHLSFLSFSHCSLQHGKLQKASFTPGISNKNSPHLGLTSFDDIQEIPLLKKFCEEDKSQHFTMPWCGCLGPGDLVKNTAFDMHNILRAPELHWILNWQGWHRRISSKNLKPKSNYSQFGLKNSINQSKLRETSALLLITTSIQP